MENVKYNKGLFLMLCILSSITTLAVGRQPTSTAYVRSSNKNKYSKDSTMQDYPFKDTAGNTVRLSDFRGKFVLIDIWYSGCGFCISANKALYAVHESLKGENIVFLSISIDSNKAKWMAGITPGAKPSQLNPSAGQYVPPVGAVALYTGESGQDNDFIRTYVPKRSYPKLLLVDPSGKLISDNPPRPDGFPIDHPELLVDFIMGYIRQAK